jgi:alkanesulfonate monooxygenase SsuD/methylene tetrahydromethanopterin reductase-like flavin-dependent oxidoreductase (luciferase family)
MRKRSSGTKPAIAEDSGGASDRDRRDFVIKVRVNAAEKMELDRQKGRLSFSAFLRDRGLNQGNVYDPTYAAIGSVYQSARNMSESAALIEGSRIDLRNSVAILESQLGQEAGSFRAVSIVEDLRQIADRLHAQAEQIERQANMLGGQAKELAEKHMKEMLKRYPATVIEPRKSR